MARGFRRLSAPGAAWAALAAVAALGSLLAAGAGLAGAPAHESLAWLRSAPGQVWRCWTAAFVHLGAAHLGANLAGSALLGLLGWQARLPVSAAVAWALAWPFTHALLWLAAQPDRYLGLSGVLHAGVAVAAVMLLGRPGGGWRGLGGGLALGLTAKLALEAPWKGAVQVSPDWPFPVAVGAHAAGAVAGILCAIVVRLALGRAGAVSPRR
ncbi:MAG: rhombosortase [Caldimonas sp.]|uniref:rhombosortase n=1 Tax=Caldimonas sp. TaxID=2838790 RepID=UPI00391BBF83